MSEPLSSRSERARLMAEIAACAHFLKGYAEPGGSDLPLVLQKAHRIIDAWKDLGTLDDAAPQSERGLMERDAARYEEVVAVFLAGGAISYHPKQREWVLLDGKGNSSAVNGSLSTLLDERLAAEPAERPDYPQGEKG